MNTKHTPAPLRASRGLEQSDGGTDYAILDENNKVIGEAFEVVGIEDTRPAYENAKLWAAAPNMLTALEAIANLAGQTLLGPDSKHKMGDDAPRYHEMGAAAAFEQAAQIAREAL